MSVVSVGYTIDLDAIRTIKQDEALAFIEIAVEELGKTRNTVENERSVLEQVFGLSIIDTSVHHDLIVAFLWLCENFGILIPSNPVWGIHNLELDTKLLDRNPPFGFPTDDENVAHLSLEEAKSEKERFRSCVDDAVDEDLASQREAYLTWLDSAIERNADLIVIET